jgi:hypothetical protein
MKKETTAKAHNLTGNIEIIVDPSLEKVKKVKRYRVKIDPLDRLFSEYIRKRSGGYCQRCGKYYGWKRLQCSHFFGRAKKSVRWDEDNAVALDFGCHQYLGSHPLEHTEWFKKHLGEDAFNLLQARARETGMPDREAIKLYLKEKIKELEK